MLEIYADESSTSNNRYAIIGGVVVNSDSRDYLNARLSALCNHYRLNNELKWQRVHCSHYIAYRSMVNEFFTLNQGNRLHFHSVIIDSTRVKGDRELGHAKFVYQLLMKFGRIYAPQQNFAVYLDEGKVQTPLAELRSMLNSGIAKRWRIHTRPFRVLETVNSKQCKLMQANDIIIGAISHAKNDRHLNPDGRPEKQVLAEYVRTRAQLRSLCVDTSIGANRFTIWNMTLEKPPQALGG